MLPVMTLHASSSISTNLFFWIGRTCVCQDTIKHLFQFYVISQIQMKNKLFKKKSCLRIKVLTGEGKSEDQGKKSNHN